MATAFHRLGGRLGRGSCRQLQHWLKVSNAKEAPHYQPWTQTIHTNASLLATINLDMPSLSPTMEKGNIIKWHKKEGDTISAGDILCDIETDKATISMDTEEEGILAKIIMPDNSKDVTVGTLIALMVEEGDDWKNVEVPASQAASPAAPSEQAKAPAPAPSAAAPVGQPASHSAEIEQGHLIGPAVKKLLTEYNLNPSAIKSTGHGGALLKSDVLAYIEANKLSRAAPLAAPSPPAPTPSAAPSPAAPAKVTPAPTPAPGTNFVDIPLTNMRRTIAKRLTESKASIPHAYSSIDSDMGAVIALRKSLKADGVKVSVNDFIIKASAMALQRVPRVNAVWAGENSQLCPSVDISVAVATPNGLITPIVHGVGNLSVDQIGDTVKELAGRAKEGKLQPNEFQGGSFTISNLGMFGVKEFTAVINPPQVAIMAVGGSRQVALPSGGAGQKMTVTLSFDSRALDEVDVTRFLMEFRHVLENAQSMLAGTGLDAEAEAFAF